MREAGAHLPGGHSLLCQVVLGICLARISYRRSSRGKPMTPARKAYHRGHDTSSAYYKNIMYIRL